MATDQESPLQEVVAWFRKAGAAGLILPDGWFGRPYDSLHRLTFSVQRPRAMLLELDSQLYLLATGNVSVKAKEQALKLSGFAQLVFCWQEYGGSTTHTRTFNSGQVQFIALSKHNR